MKEMLDALNEMGNALTSLGWPEGTSVMPNGKKIVYNTAETYKRLAAAVSDMVALNADYQDSVNELCLMCGQYKKEHVGACDACRWKIARRSA